MSVQEQVHGDWGGFGGGIDAYLRQGANVTIDSEFGEAPPLRGPHPAKTFSLG